jgi:hypothetical protein
MSSLIRVTDISLAQPESLRAYNLDTPEAGRVIETSGRIEVTGWVVGKDAAATGIEISSGDGFRRRSLINGHRPDVAAVFPDVAWAVESGFGIYVPVEGPAAEVELDISVILADHRIVPLATVHGERTWRGAERRLADSVVSVVISCDGQASFLRDAIASVMAQTHPHLEVVVVADDRSSDEAAEITRSYPGVRCVRQEGLGLAEARNTGIRHTIGDFLVFIDATDRLLPGAVEIGLQAFAAKPASGFVFGDRSWIGPDGRRLNMDPPPAPRSDAGYLDLLEQRSLHLGAVVFRRDAFEGGRRRFDPTISASADWDVLLNGMRDFPVFRHGQTVTECRPLTSTVSGDTALLLASDMAVLRRHRKTARSLSGGREAYHAAVRRCTLRHGPGAADQLRRALGHRQWGLATSTALTLARYYPRGLFCRSRGEQRRLSPAR